MSVCAACFTDTDIKARILAEDGEPGCEFCGEVDAPTMDFDAVSAFMYERLLMFWSLAIEELMYDDESESGYGGETWTSDEILFEDLLLDLPRDRDGSLRAALTAAMGEEPWCELDPARVPAHEGMVMDWEQFAERATRDGDAVMKIVEPEHEYDDLTPPGLVLPHLATAIQRLGLIAEWQRGAHLFRARPRDRHQNYTRPGELGPPPAALATQSNRMNAAGDPMFYVAERAATAVAEANAQLLSVGLFSVERELRLLDLDSLPPAPGIFSSEPADDIRTLWFLHEFADLISNPVERLGDRVPEYVPTQLMTSFLRSHPFQGGPIDGIRYRSAARQDANERQNANIVLFATDADVQANPPKAGGGQPYLRLVSTFQLPEDSRSLEAADDADIRASQRRVEVIDTPALDPLPLLTWNAERDGVP